MMMSSAMFDSKLTGLYTSNDTHEFFTSICDKLTQLEDKRIVEKLARPIPLENKVQLMNDANRSLQHIRTIMDQIQECCPLLKGKEDAIVQ